LLALLLLLLPTRVAGLALVLVLITPLLSILWLLLLSAMLLSLPLATPVTGHLSWAALEVDIHASSVLLGCILQAKLLANLLNAGLDFLNMVYRVVAFAYDAICVLSAIISEITSPGKRVDQR
jgi:hypothetical protein